MKVIKVYRARKYSEVHGHVFTGLYRTREGAAEQSDYDGQPEERDAVQFEDGSVRLFDKYGPQRFTEDIENIRKRALEKLTPDEREILGIKEK